jgi:hypothetical protein
MLGGLLLSACNDSGSSPGFVPNAAKVQVRFAEGAPSLEAIVNGAPTPVCGAIVQSCYFEVNGATVSNQWFYSYLTPYTSFRAGTLSLTAADSVGYTIGPIKTDSLAAGKSYTVILVGTYPHYRALAFEDPSSSSGAQLALYEASPATPQAAFGSFKVSTRSNFKQLGTTSLGHVAAVPVGNNVTDFGGYAGPISSRIGTVTPAQVDDSDTKNALPFHAANRLSLFLFDATGSGKVSQLFGSLDQ